MIDICKKTCEKLSAIPAALSDPKWIEDIDKEVCVVYPAYNTGLRRFSEQEARFVFTMLLRNAGIPFSVEVPTVNRFKFGTVIDDIEKDSTGKSASYDLVVYPSIRTLVYVEFKAHNVDLHSVAKDIFKLSLCGKGAKIFFHAIENANRRTFLSLAEKYNLALEYAESHGGQVQGVKILVAVTGMAKLKESLYQTALFEYKKGEFIPL